ncbi:MAG: DUF1553 domain-containing protein [Saprospiraceae bacterium]|nr:DUF1553 domain-containing protein [Saprospiraceae bacterium]
MAEFTTLRSLVLPAAGQRFLKYLTPLLAVIRYLRNAAIGICILLGTFACMETENAESGPLPDVVDFNLHVRPILSNNCFVCHGPDISSRKAGLRLDLEETAKSNGESGKQAIVAGNSRSSELFRRITASDPEVRMPPTESNRELTAYQKAVIGRWIDQGAEWKPHWAFIDPIDQQQNTAINPIDGFIQQNLAHHQLTAAQPATSQVLARRLSYLLTGLPPDQPSLDLDLTRDDDYESYVDSLLNSPHYGERWARHWMDLMRYAEGRGHEFDYPVIGAWHYRDYLIRAFNQDVPYDQLVKEHLAGDLLEYPRLDKNGKYNESILGTISLNLGEGKHSPVDTKEEEKIRIDNMIDVTSKSFLGLTVACARCHDHKFDAIPTTDYYAMYGMFESTRTHLIPPYTPIARELAIDSLVQLKKKLKNYVSSLAPSPTNEAELIAKKDHITTRANNVKFLGDFRGSNFGEWQSDGLAFGNQTTLGDAAIDWAATKGSLVQEGVASSRRFAQGLSGALRSPTFIIDHDYLIFRAAGNESSIRVVLDNLQLIQNPIHGELSQKINDPIQRDYTAYVGMWKGSKAYIEIMPGEYYSKDGKGHHFRMDPEAWIEASYVLALDTVTGQSAEELINGGPSDTPKTREVSVNLDRQILQEYQEEYGRFSSWSPDTVFAAAVTDAGIIESPVFIRGDHKNLSKEKVPHRFLSVLSELDSKFEEVQGSRMAFALAIVDKDNPLTARVMVNRIWHHLFGRGLVATVDNFGLQGELPTNLALLDHLAIKFMDFNWSIKKMIKYIVSSATFKQSTGMIESNLQIDPDNTLLHCYPVRRLEAEAIRDAILATSGRLDLSMYGPSIPLYLTDFLGGRGRPAASGPLDGEGRRSIYQAVWRNFLPPFMLTFDMPIPFSTFGDRMETNVPAQSLTLLNDPFVQEQAKVWATVLCAKYPDTKSRLEAAYLTAFGRRPSQEESDNSLIFLKNQRENYQLENSEETTILVWTDYCHSLFNTKEFIYLI